MSEVKKSIKKRKRGAPVRLELLTKCSADIKAFLIEMLGIKKNEIFELPGPLDLTFFSKFAGVKGFESLCFAPIRPVNPPADFWGYTDILRPSGRRTGWSTTPTRASTWWCALSSRPPRMKTCWPSSRRCTVSPETPPLWRR